MAQNTEKYFYINRVGLLRDSWAHKRFERDAKDHHMEDQPGKLVALRLTEYYELLERLGGVWPVPGSPLTGVVAAANGANGKSPLPGQGRQDTLEEDEDEELVQTKESDNPEEALDESIDYWTNL